MEIRNATSTDMSGILQLVKELADFEREPNAVSATLEDYKRLFSEGLFECVVASVDGVIVGIALYYDTFSTWKGKMLYLEDLVVTKSLRKQGIGKALFNEFLARAKEKGAVLAKWQVLDWNIEAINFYKMAGATIEKGWWNVKITL